MTLLIGLPARPTGAAAQPQPGGMGVPIPGEVLIGFDPGVPAEALSGCLRSVHATRKRDIGELHASRLQVGLGPLDAVLVRLRACPGILYAEPNYRVSALGTFPDDPGYASQYGLVNIRAPQGWDISTGSSSVILAIIDSGIDLSHEDLAGKITAGYNVLSPADPPQDDFGHGTHVAGIAAASTNNGIGVAGVSWGARLMPVKMLDASGNGDFAGAAEGITWAADHGARIINMSFGGVSATLPQTLQNAVNYAYAKGVLLVAAAGNDARNENYYPANLANVLAVTATDSLNQKYNMANYGPSIDLAAPGVSIYSTLPGNAYGLMTGTSMASPFVAGLASILRGLAGNASPEQITQELEQTALDLGTSGKDYFYGYGLIQADAALASVRGLTVSRIGSGRVSSSDGGIDCGQTCLAAYALGAAVTLTAAASAGGAFLGWSDPACPAAVTCIVTMDTDKSITAKFTTIIYLPLIMK